MDAQATDNSDERSAQQLVTQHRKIQEIKRHLVKEGSLNGDATPQQVFDALRKQIPPDLFL